MHQGLLVRLPLPLCAGRHLVVLHDPALRLLEPRHHTVRLLQLQEEGLQGPVIILKEYLLNNGQVRTYFTVLAVALIPTWLPARSK